MNDFGLKQMGTNVDEMLGFMSGFGYSHTNLGESGATFVYNVLFSLEG